MEYLAYYRYTLGIHIKILSSTSQLFETSKGSIMTCATLFISNPPVKTSSFFRLQLKHTHTSFHITSLTVLCWWILSRNKCAHNHTRNIFADLQMLCRTTVFSRLMIRLPNRIPFPHYPNKMHHPSLMPFTSPFGARSNENAEGRHTLSSSLISVNDYHKHRTPLVSRNNVASKGFVRINCCLLSHFKNYSEIKHKQVTQPRQAAFLLKKQDEKEELLSIPDSNGVNPLRSHLLLLVWREIHVMPIRFLVLTLGMLGVTIYPHISSFFAAVRNALQTVFFKNMSWFSEPCFVPFSRIHTIPAVTSFTHHTTQYSYTLGSGGFQTDDRGTQKCLQLWRTSWELSCKAFHKPHTTPPTSILSISHPPISNTAAVNFEGNSRTTTDDTGTGQRYAQICYIRNRQFNRQQILLFHRLRRWLAFFFLGKKKLTTDFAATNERFADSNWTHKASSGPRSDETKKTTRPGVANCSA